MIKPITTRESSFAAFAKAMPKIMDKALQEQRPYRNSFLKRIGITYEEYTLKNETERESIQNDWIHSAEFKEMLSKY